MKRLLAFLALAAMAAAQDPADWLRGEATVTTAAQRAYRGELRGIEGGRLLLAAREPDGGEVLRRFARGEVESLAFPGAEAVAAATDAVERGDWSAARPLLEAIARQREPYADFLGAGDLALLVALVEARLQADAAVDAIALARRLRARPAAAPWQDPLLDAELVGHWRLGLAEETAALAEAWCRAAAPGGRSALGWRVLADLAFRAGDDERARWLALQPVAFASFENPPHLDGCYALAAAAALRAGDEAHAELLFAEMTARGLAWPDDAGLGEARAELAGRAARRAAAATAEAATLPPPGPPAPDQHLPLDRVRKLISQPEPR